MAPNTSQTRSERIVSGFIPFYSPITSAPSLHMTRVVRGHIVFPDPSNLSSALVIVTLRDTTLADAPATTVTELRFKLSGDLLLSIPFEIDVSSELPRSRSYTLSAEIRQCGQETVPGKHFLSTTAVPWHPNFGRTLEIPIQSVGDHSARSTKE